MGSRHEAVTCDACARSSFELRRYKCLRCFDYDLCGNCYDNECETKSHLKTHPMQCLLLESDRKIFFSNDQSEKKVHSYTCPICGEKGFEETNLASHVFAEHPASHKSAKVEVICPLCAVPTDSSSNPRTLFLAQHLTLGHRLKKPTKSANLVDDKSETAAEFSTSIVPNPSQILLRHTMSKHASTYDRGRSKNITLSTASVKHPNNVRQEEELAHIFALESSTLRQLTTSNSRLVNGKSKMRTVPRSPASLHNHVLSPLVKSSDASLSKSESMVKRFDNHQITNSDSRHNNQNQISLLSPPNTTLDMPWLLTPLAVDKKHNNGLPTELSTIKLSSQAAEINHVQLSDTEKRLTADFEVKPSSAQMDSFGELMSNHGEGTMNLISLVLNSNSVDLSAQLDVDTDLSGKIKGVATEPASSVSSHTLVAPVSAIAPVSKASKKICDDRMVCQKDNFGSDWSSFLHELIFDSLQLTGLREQLTGDDGDPD